MLHSDLKSNIFVQVYGRKEVTIVPFSSARRCSAWASPPWATADEGVVRCRTDVDCRDRLPLRSDRRTTASAPPPCRTPTCPREARPVPDPLHVAPGVVVGGVHRPQHPVGRGSAPGGEVRGLYSLMIDVDRDHRMREALERLEVDVLVFWPLWRETFSFTVYEAVAAGWPVGGHAGGAAEHLGRLFDAHHTRLYGLARRLRRSSSAPRA